MDRFGAYARILFWGVVLQPDRRLGIDDAYVHDPRNQHHCYRIQRRQFVCQEFRSGRDGNGAGGRSQRQPRDFRKNGWAQDYIQFDLLGLITAAFTNVKFQIDSTEGGDQWQVTACSTAGVSGSGPCTANASTPVGSDGTLNLEPVEPERNEPLPGYRRDQGERAARRTSGFRSIIIVFRSLIVRTTAGRNARSCGRLLCQTVGNAKGKIEATILEGRGLTPRPFQHESRNRIGHSRQSPRLRRSFKRPPAGFARHDCAWWRFISRGNTPGRNYRPNTAARLARCTGQYRRDAVGPAALDGIRGGTAEVSANIIQSRRDDSADTSDPGRTTLAMAGDSSA